MAEDEILDSFRNVEDNNIGRSLRSSFRRHVSSFRSSSGRSSVNLDEETVAQWEAIDRLPTFERLRSSVFFDDEDDKKRVVDVTKIGAPERHMFIEKLIKHIQHDNLKLLHKIRKRIDK